LESATQSWSEALKVERDSDSEERGHGDAQTVQHGGHVRADPAPTAPPFPGQPPPDAGGVAELRQSQSPRLLRRAA